MPKKSIKFIGIKSPNKKLYIITIILVVVSLFLTSCAANSSPADVVVEYQVPFAQSGHNWNEIELVGTDDYGREMYSYKSGKAYTNVFRDFMSEEYYRAAPVLLYLIIQKRDNDFVYCYDNCCYVYVKSFQGNNDYMIDNLKELNDWGKPLDDEKLTSLSIDAFDDVDGYKVTSITEQAVSTLEELLEKEIADYYLDDIFLDSNTPIFVLRIVESREPRIYGKSYVFNLSSDQMEASYFELSDDINTWNEEIHNFKMTLKTG